MLLIHNAEIADMFDRLADLLALEDANPFRVRAYHNAALAIRGDTRNMADLLAQGFDLAKLPAIGKDLSAKIKTIVETGRFPLLEQVEARIPSGLSDLMRLEGLGPKRVKALYQGLQISSIEDLKRAVRSGKIKELDGFGNKTEQLISDQLARFAATEKRLNLIEAEQIATPLLQYLRANRAVQDLEIAGSYRRRQETIGDLDILITTSRKALIMDYFVAYEGVAEVISKGLTRAAVRLRSGLKIDLRVVSAISYGSALQYFTGSKAHNIALRKQALGLSYKINEYGVFQDDRRIAGKTEAEVYQQINLPYIPPELRENKGELEAAHKNSLPKLITLSDIQGDLHCHTNATDGYHSLEDMVTAAAARNYHYISINDHSRHLTVAHGLDESRLWAQIREIDRLNELQDRIVVLKSIEVDILEDGQLDLPEAVLNALDFTVCAVHSHFHLARKQQTERILRAMDNRHFTILAHPTGRLINERKPYPIDLEKIIQGARDRACFLELNAQPQRLDLDDDACRLAKEMGLKLAISSDAHSLAQFDYLRFGIDQARRGWLEAKDVINCLPYTELRRLFKQRN